MTAITAFFDSLDGKTVYAVLALALVDFALGTLAAFRDGTFALDSVAAWLRKHLLGRVAPIVVLVASGYFMNQPALTAVGAIAGAAYLAETIGSITDSWGPNREVQPVPED